MSTNLSLAIPFMLYLNIEIVDIRWMSYDHIQNIMPHREYGLMAAEDWVFFFEVAPLTEAIYVALTTDFRG
jgi:hypothetical protein